MTPLNWVVKMVDSLICLADTCWAAELFAAFWAAEADGRTGLNVFSADS